MFSFKEYLNENTGKIIKGKLFFSDNDYETLYTLKAGSKYALNNDKSVYWTDNKSDLKNVTPEKPNAPKNKLIYDLMNVDNVFGIYDSNMKLIAEYDYMEEFIDDYKTGKIKVNLESFM